MDIAIGMIIGSAISIASQGFKNLADNAELLKIIFGTLISLKLAQVIAQTTVSVKGLTTAFAILNAVVARNPFLVVGGVAVTAVALFGKQITELSGTV